MAETNQTLQGEANPVEPGDGRDPGLTLCLSGGGFRATLFHLGALHRLNELGVLSQVRVISSVSGGSILNGILATRWSQLSLDGGRFTDFKEKISQATRNFCAKDLRTPLLLGTRCNPLNLPALVRDRGSVAANFLAKAYEKLFQGVRLHQIPAPSEHVPRFVFCATSVQTGACWQFHCGPEARMGDFYTGYCDVGDVRVSEAVAASSAFPPGFGALRLQLPHDSMDRIDPWGRKRDVSAKRNPILLDRKGRILLTDGGVYDNLGVEPIWNQTRSLLVSNAGRPFGSVLNVRQAIVPRLSRAAEISAEQVGAVRLRWLVERLQLQNHLDELLREFPAGEQDAVPAVPDRIPVRTGTLWAIDSRLKAFPLDDARGYDEKSVDLLAAVRTDLNSFTPGEISCLVNHGYSMADSALRGYAPELCLHPDHPFEWPDADFCSDEKAEEALADSHARHFFRDVRNYVTQLLTRSRQP